MRVLKNTIISLLFFTGSFISYSQGVNEVRYDEIIQNPIGSWSAYHTVHYQNNPDVWVKVQFNIAGCVKTKQSGSTLRSYFRILNSYSMDNVVHFKFDFRDCNGQVQTHSVSFSMKGTGTDDKWWYYFYGAEIVRAPYDISFNYPDKLKSQSELDKKLDASTQKTIEKINESEKSKTPHLKSNSTGMGTRADNNSAQPESVAMTNGGNNTNTKQQQQALQRQQEAEQKQAQQRIQEELQELQRQSQQQMNLTNSMVDAVGSFARSQMTNTIRQNIAKDNSRRDQRFEELKNHIQSEHGHLINCNSCDGAGYKDCNQCSSTGTTVCGSCGGQSGKTCMGCNGTGIAYYIGTTSFPCTSCSGKGITSCSYCESTGKMICINCNGLGKWQCGQCEGTGKEFKRDYSHDNYTNPNNSNQSSSSANYSNTQATQNASPKYEYARDFSGGLKVVRSNGKMGVVDKNDFILIPIKYDGTGDHFVEGCTMVNLNNKWGYVDSTGREIIPPQYDQIKGDFSEGLSGVCINGNWGFINKTGKVIIPLKYESVYPFSEGFAAVRVNGNWGVVNKIGQVVISPKFDSTDVNGLSFKRGLAIVKLNDKTFGIDYTGNEALCAKPDIAMFTMKVKGATKTASNLYFFTEREGTGKSPVKDQKIAIHYIITLLNGKKIASTYDSGQPFEFIFGQKQIMTGLQEGIGLMKSGSKMRFIIPPHLAFGAASSEEILPNSTLIFEVELIDIKAGTESYALSDKDAFTTAIKGAIKTTSNLYYFIEREGTGNKPVVGQKAVIHYTETLLNGKKIDSSYDRGQPFEFIFGQKQVIAGLEEGVALMKVGSKMRLIIQPHLAYGADAIGPIPANSTLVFEVELINVKAK